MRTLIILLFIAFGMLCSPSAILSFKYSCTGSEVFPVFYGSPFIYKSTSLATSLAFDYYALGFLGSWLTWALVIGAIWYLVKRFLLREDNKVIANIYSVVVGLLVFFAVMSLIFAAQTNAGSTIQWELDLDKVANEHGMSCTKEFFVTAQ